MNELEKLWNVLSRDGFYTKSFDEFANQTQDKSYQDKVYGVAEREGYFTKGQEAFNEKYFLGQDPLKKKEDSELPSTPPQDGMESTAQEVEVSGTSAGSAPQSGEKDTLIERVVGKNIPIVSGFADFVGDIYRSAEQGYVQGNTADESYDLMFKGANTSEKDIEEFLAAQEELASMGQTDEMKRFNEVYDESGGGLFGFIKGLSTAPISLMAQLAAQTTAQMVNKASAGAVGATVGTGATAGAVGGSAFGGIGAIPGAIGGAISSLPFAFGASGAALETGISFSEFLREEVEAKGLDFNKENISIVLNDADALRRIRTKSAGRGAIIGIIDRYSAGLGGKYIGKLAAKGAGKGKRAAVALGAESVGGGVGETAARLFAGQDLDAREIGFETIGGAGKAPLTYAYGKLVKPAQYFINGEQVGLDIYTESLNADDKSFAGTTFDVKNDPELKNQTEERKERLRSQSEINKAKLKAESDAIQESSTESVDVQEQTTVSETMGEGDTQEQTVTEEVEQEFTEPSGEAQVETTPEIEAEIESLEQALPEQANNNVDAQLQLDTEVTPKKKKTALVQEAVEMMEDPTNQTKLEEEAFDATNPAPNVKTYQIDVKENSKLAAKVKRMGLSELIGKRVNLVMADQLKVGEVKVGNKKLKRMGGPFFPMMEEMFGKVAWASIDEVAAKKIINGAIKSDFSVVYNMSPSAVDSNVAILETFVESVNGLDSDTQDKVFELMSEKLKTQEFKKSSVEKVRGIANSAKNINEMMSLISGLDVDTKADIMKKLVPSKNVQAETQLGGILQQNKITIEDIRDLNIEQFASDLPAGALTTVLQVTDKQGNPITKETASEAILTRDQQEAEGLPKHENYPVYIRGKAVGLLKETVPFWNMYKSSMSSLNAKAAGLVKKKVAATKTKPASKRNITSKEARSNEMRSASMSASQSRKLSSPETTTYKKFVSLLQRAFPNVEVMSSQEDFDALTKDLNSKSLSTKSQKVYGAVMNGKLYLNPGLENFNTPIHEFGHIWLNVAKEAKPELFKKGMSLIKGTAYETQIKESPEYKRVVKQMLKDGASQETIDAYILEEALATAIGDQGEAFVTAAQKISFKTWLQDLYSFVKNMTGLSQYSPDQLENITLSEFLKGVNVDLLSGNEVFAGAEAKGLSDALQLMTDSSDEEVRTFVEKARGLGYSEIAIKAVLEKRGFESDVVSEAMSGIEADTKAKITEDLVPGSDSVKKQIDNLIQRIKVKAKNNYKNKMSAFPSRGSTKTVNKKDVFPSALKLLKNSKVYKESTDVVREQAVRELRKEFGLKEKASPSKASLDSNFGKEITTTDKKLYVKRLNDLQEGAKTAQQAMKEATNLITENVKALVKKGSITNAQAQRILNRLAKVDVLNDSSINSFMDYMANVYNKSESKYKNTLINNILKRVSKSAKKSKSVDADSQQFFEVMKTVLNKVLAKVNGKPVKIDSESIKESLFPDIDTILQKDFSELTNKEKSQLYASEIFESVDGLRDMSLEQVEQLLEDVKRGQEGGRLELKKKLDAFRAEVKEVQNQADKNIEDGYSELFDGGKPKDKNQLDADRDARRIKLFGEGLGDAINKYAKEFSYTKVGKMIQSIGNNLKHLGTLANGLDKAGSFFKKNVYDALNRMESAYTKGLQGTRSKMDEIAKTIDGINSYKDIKRKLATGVHKITGLKTSRGVSLSSVEFNADQLMRLYALSKNEIQRKKLLAQGLTDKKLKEIEAILGKEVVEFVNKTVEYLSTEYFEKTNDVYSDVNNVNLGYVDDYFPTQTIQTKVNADLLENGDFSGVFNAQTAPALKERVDLTGDVDLRGSDFTSTLENHFETIERYKAYAKGVKKMNSIFKFKSVNTLLNESGLNSAVKNAINYAVNPNGGKSAIQANLIDNFMTKYTGFALAFKAVQILKQSTSFVNAFEDYSYRGKGKSKIPGLDLLMFMVDGAKVAVTMPSQIKKAWNMSPMFQERLLKGLEGDVYGLETGSVTYKPASQSQKNRAFKMLKAAAGSPTVFGDILGVMGYMINYNRDIANGMSEADALAKFEDYNATQQSRRSTDKIPLQMNSNSLVRGFTMFGSTLFLQMNKVMQSTTNILRSISKRENPSAKSVRGLVLNLGVANVMFALAANISKFIKGEDEDREEALAKMKEAMMGLNLIYQIPYFGAAAEEAINKMTGKGGRPVDSVVNPFSSLSRKFTRLAKLSKKEKDDGQSKSLSSAVRVLVEILLGVQFDPFIGLSNFFQGDFSEDNVYDVLGISSSYRPKAKSDSQIRKEKLGQYDNETDMKRYDRGLWERTFGSQSEGYKEREAIKEEKKQEAKRKREMKDLEYNYKTPPKRSRKSGSGSSFFGSGKSKSKKSRNSFFN